MKKLFVKGVTVLAAILTWLIKSKGVKIAGSAAVGGGGVIALVLTLHQDVTNKIEKIETDRAKYVGLVLKPVETEIAHLKDETKETKDMVRDIHNYLLKSKEN